MGSRVLGTKVDLQRYASVELAQQGLDKPELSITPRIMPSIPPDASPSTHIGATQPPFVATSCSLHARSVDVSNLRRWVGLLRGVAGLDRQLSAVDSDAFAVDVAGIVGAEECDDFCDFFGFAESALRNI